MTYYDQQFYKQFIINFIFICQKKHYQTKVDIQFYNYQVSDHACQQHKDVKQFVHVEKEGVKL